MGGKTQLLRGQNVRYLFVFSISVCFEAFRGVQLDGGAAYNLDAALLILQTQGPYTTVHLSKSTGGGHIQLH